MKKEILEKMAREKGSSPFERSLRQMPVAVCQVFRNSRNIVPASFHETGQVLETPDTERISPRFAQSIACHGNRVLEAVQMDASQPKATGKKVLVLFSGGPAAGGNNVITGLFRALGPENKLFGVKAGPGGLIKGDTFEIGEQQARGILNTGGFDFLGSDRTKIEEAGQFNCIREVCRSQGIHAIVVVGGDDSNTNAAFLAEFLFQDVHDDGSGVQVIGVPKTIDGDLQVPGLLPISFGFDTATRIYAAIVGNIAKDTPSSRKYYHFIKIMGRSASHVALEVALMIRPSITFVSEEVAQRALTLDRMVEGIAYTIARRAARGIRHGVVIIPEGLIEFVPDFRNLIGELNRVIDIGKQELEPLSPGDKKSYIRDRLAPTNQQMLDRLPAEFRNMLLLDRDDHGNLPVSQIQTERLLMQLTAEKILHMQQNPADYDWMFKKFSADEQAAFHKFHFSPLAHFLGYEGRCGAPSKFDMAFTFNLGLCAGSLILAGKTGYMASVAELDSGGRPVAIPLTGLINVEQRGAREKLVIKKALVELEGPAFLHLKDYRKYWAAEDFFHSTGPRQYWGPESVTDTLPLSVVLNNRYGTRLFDLGKELPVFLEPEN